jgi:hypothetical protein
VSTCIPLSLRFSPLSMTPSKLESSIPQHPSLSLLSYLPLFTAPPAWFCSWVALSPENAMTHVTPAAAGCQVPSHFTKCSTQNLGDSILNSLESLLSKMTSNSPPPTQCHAFYHLHNISTSACHPCCCRSQTCSPFHHNTPHPKTSLIEFYTHVIVHKCPPCPCDSKNVPHSTIRERLLTWLPWRGTVHTVLP